MTKILFIGNFPKPEEPVSHAVSSAGKMVQLQILKALESDVDNDVKAISLRPIASWPRGPLIIFSSTANGSMYFPGFVNVPIIKNICFSSRLIMHIVTWRPKLTIQYNSFFFENISLLLLRFIRGFKIAAIVQDVLAGSSLGLKPRNRIRQIFEVAGAKLLRRFDFVIPVSFYLAAYLRLRKGKYLVFRGGATDAWEALISTEETVCEKIGVFAGAVEDYNGGLKLAKAWIDQGIKYDLHMFGHGSCASILRELAECSEFVHFHGQVPEATVASFQSRALWNFCLRYSIGIDERFYFPSKLFNILPLRGHVIANRFKGLWGEYLDHVTMVDADLGNLSCVLEDCLVSRTDDNLQCVRDLFEREADWAAALNSMLVALDCNAAMSRN